MEDNWKRWQQDAPYRATDQVDIIYLDHKNQVCLKREHTATLDWAREDRPILSWRGITEQLVAVEPEKAVAQYQCYWNCHTRKFWRRTTVLPDRNVPGFMKLTVHMTDPISITYEIHSISIF